MRSCGSDAKAAAHRRRRAARGEELPSGPDRTWDETDRLARVAVCATTSFSESGRGRRRSHRPPSPLSPQGKSHARTRPYPHTRPRGTAVRQGRHQGLRPLHHPRPGLPHRPPR
ncbi:hypothetical protein ACH3WN_15085 [Streptomyces albogriseolus]|uniref:hypothetical protein n=1 Tax=Streptomyces albogriseolus TaxID=1887 RepID=UPI0037A4E975